MSQGKAYLLVSVALVGTIGIGTVCFFSTTSASESGPDSIEPVEVGYGRVEAWLERAKSELVRVVVRGAEPTQVSDEARDGTPLGNIEHLGELSGEELQFARAAIGRVLRRRESALATHSDEFPEERTPEFLAEEARLLYEEERYRSFRQALDNGDYLVLRNDTSVLWENPPEADILNCGVLKSGQPATLKLVIWRRKYPAAWAVADYRDSLARDYWEARARAFNELDAETRAHRLTRLPEGLEVDSKLHGIVRARRRFVQVPFER